MKRVKSLKAIGSHVFVRKLEDETNVSGIIVAGVSTPRYLVVNAPEGASFKDGDTVYVDPHAEPEMYDDLYVYRHSNILAVVEP